MSFYSIYDFAFIGAPVRRQPRVSLVSTHRLAETESKDPEGRSVFSKLNLLGGGQVQVEYILENNDIGRTLTGDYIYETGAEMMADIENKLLDAYGTHIIWLLSYKPKGAGGGEPTRIDDPDELTKLIITDQHSFIVHDIKPQYVERRKIKKCLDPMTGHFFRHLPIDIFNKILSFMSIPNIATSQQMMNIGFMDRLNEGVYTIDTLIINNENLTALKNIYLVFKMKLKIKPKKIIIVNEDEDYLSDENKHALYQIFINPNFIKNECISFIARTFNFENIPILKLFRDLKTIDIFGGDTRDLSLLLELSQLNYLDLHANPIDDANLIYITHCVTLTYLVISNINFTNESFSQLQTLINLQHLSIENSGFDDYHIINFNILINFPHLTVLNLMNRNLHDADLLIISGLVNLTELILFGNGLILNYDCLSALQRLISINLTYCNISLTQLENLIVNIPILNEIHVSIAHEGHHINHNLTNVNIQALETRFVDRGLTIHTRG